VNNSRLYWTRWTLGHCNGLWRRLGRWP